MPNDATSDKALAALHQASLAIAGNLALDKVLRQIVDSARHLVKARYAALGVPDNGGGLVEFVYTGLSPEVANTIGYLPQGRGLLGAILQEGHSIRLPDIRQDPRAVGYPENHPVMTSFLGVPIQAGAEIVGNIYLTDKMDAPEFSAEDQALIEQFAAHGALAIQNARLYEKVRRLAVIEERSRIGMDLHDGFIQSVYAVGLTLESARLSLTDEQAEVIELIDHAIAGLNDAISDIRNFILDLRPRHFEGDLKRGLARLTREFQANSMVHVKLEVTTELAASLPPAIARSLFFTAQEALANVARHARATTVIMRVDCTDENIILVVQDDGIGFDVNAQQYTTGHGLANMRQRTEERGGRFLIDSVPGRGTHIQMSLPL